MKRAGLAGAVVVLMILLVGGVALAKTVLCQTGASCVGTNKDDLLVGTSAPDNVQGFGGDDVLKGREGSDNTLRGDEGNDRVLGGPGFDFLEGGSGKDVVKGGADGDVYFHPVGWGKETIVDTPIVDTNLDTGHFARFDSVEGDLTINLNSRPRAPEVKTANGKNTLNWQDDLIDSIVDGEGDDTIVGRDVGDNIQPFAGGVDQVRARGGDDFVYAADGFVDEVDCGKGNDTVRGDAGDAIVNCETVQIY